MKARLENAKRGRSLIYQNIDDLKKQIEQLEARNKSMKELNEIMEKNKTYKVGEYTYDTASGKTIVDDALSGNHTYDDLVKLAKEWYKKNESSDVNEGFKPGDMWSKDFDYEGMLKFASKVNVNTPIKTLNALFDSATDVNYHTPFRNLGIAIDWIEDGDKKGAKDYIKMFKDDIKKEMKSQGIK